MAVSARSLTEVLAGIVGAPPATDRPLAEGITARWLVRPTSLEQLSAVVGLAHDEGLAVIPRGSGSAQALGGVPRRTDIVLDLSGLDAILEYNADDLTVTVGAGVSRRALAARLAGRGQFLAIDPAGGAGRTLGGIAATGASGPLRARYGTMRDLLLGVRFVQADGVLTWGGAKVVKSVTGYDIPKLMVGALGTLGVLGELTLRLHPVPGYEASWLVEVGGGAAAHALVAAILDSTLQPSRVEVLNGVALDAVGEPGDTALAVSIGTVEAAVRAQEAMLGELAGRAGATVRAVDAAFWRRYAAMQEPGRGVGFRVTTLVSRLADTLAEIERATAASAPGASASVCGCATLGALRARVMGADVPAAARLIERLRAFLAPDGGSVVVEHGSLALRTAVDPWGVVEPGQLALMRKIKHEFDPAGVLNPGRFVGGL